MKIPEDLRNVPGVLKRFMGKIPEHSLVLVAYTVSSYRPASGNRKDQPTFPLNVAFGVLLYDKPCENKSSDAENHEQGDDAAEESVSEQLEDDDEDEALSEVEEEDEMSKEL